jgi:hypothetical protein
LLQKRRLCDACQIICGGELAVLGERDTQDDTDLSLAVAFGSGADYPTRGKNARALRLDAQQLPGLPRGPRDDIIAAWSHPASRAIGGRFWRPFT